LLGSNFLTWNSFRCRRTSRLNFSLLYSWFAHSYCCTRPKFISCF